MYQITIIVFREFLEISLLIGFLSAIGKDIKDFRVILATGIIMGAVCSSLLAFFTDYISNSLDGVGGEIFDATVILLTSLLICVTLTWMKGYTHSLSQKINQNQYEDLYSKILLTLLITTSIFREGAEIVLILHSFLAINKSDNIGHVLGFGLGAFLGCLSGLVLYLGLFTFARKYIFSVTSFFMTFVAAGLAAESAKIFVSIGFMANLDIILWDSSSIVSDSSVVGRFLKVLIGYHARPCLAELIFYLGTIFLILVAEKIFTGKKTYRNYNKIKINK